MNLRTACFRLLTAAFFVANFAASTGANAQNFDKSVVITPQVRAELLAHAPQGVAPGQPLWVGLQITHQPQWHTYWKNAGDSGLPTQMHWTLPSGVTAGEIAWPTPMRIRVGTLANYGYEDTVLLPVPLTVSPDFRPDLLNPDLNIRLRASWLVCRTECIPEDGEFTLKIPVRGSTGLHGAAFDAALAAQPRPLAQPGAVEVAGQQAIRVSLQGLPAAWQGKTLDFFPEIPEIIETAAPWTQAWQGVVWTAEVPLTRLRSAAPAVLPLVVTNGREGWRTEALVSGTWPAVVPLAALSPALESALQANRITSPGLGSAPNLTLVAALLGAVLGGLILNLMPCVFPVLAIKVVGFTRHAEDRRGHRVAGFAYAAGVVLSFVALGAFMLGLRAAGQQLGWGFQLQSPGMVAALAVLFTLLGLNLAGVFNVGQMVPGNLAAFEARHPVGNSFLSGVLAVAIASPCTAPFMGASLGFAVGLPAAQALAVFAALGVGMALPYLLASLVPAVARLLPRPGPWMETFRRLMAFPMFGTVVWLVWVLGQQSGIDGAGALLALLVGLSAVVWSLGLQGHARIIVSAVFIAIFAILSGAIGQNITKSVESTATTAATDRWQPWAPGKVDQLLAGSQPVFVDFTAAWCVTCQYNKKTTLMNADVLADLDAKRVVTLRADWTRRDPAITAALGQLGRNGVPVYVFYRSGHPPVVLSEVLSVDDVRAAIAQL